MCMYSYARGFDRQFSTYQLSSTRSTGCSLMRTLWFIANIHAFFANSYSYVRWCYQNSTLPTIHHTNDIVSINTRSSSKATLLNKGLEPRTRDPALTYRSLFRLAHPIINKIVLVLSLNFIIHVPINKRRKFARLRVRIENNNEIIIYEILNFPSFSKRHNWTWHSGIQARVDMPWVRVDTLAVLYHSATAASVPTLPTR